MTIERVGIIGTGLMGPGIAEVVASSGFDVVVRGRTASSTGSCLAKVEKSLDRRVKRAGLPVEDRDATLARVRGVTDLAELAACDLVIESVVESLEVKQELFADLDRVCDDRAILATNTSTLPVVELAMSVQRPERVCGLHFFNPAPSMDLVEVVPALTTSDETTLEAWNFAVACGKTPVTVKDQAGFIVNALLFPYLNAAVRMLESGVASKDDIDTAMRGGCGFPLGPFQLLDLVGLDTALAILEALYEERREPGCVPAALLRRMVTAGHLGRKSGEGFYAHAAPAPARAPAAAAAP